MHSLPTGVEIPRNMLVSLYSQLVFMQLYCHTSHIRLPSTVDVLINCPCLIYQQGSAVWVIGNIPQYLYCLQYYVTMHVSFRISFIMVLYNIKQIMKHHTASLQYSDGLGILVPTCSFTACDVQSSCFEKYIIKYLIR